MLSLPPARLFSKEIYYEQLGQVYRIDETEYQYYANVKRTQLATWGGIEEDLRMHAGIEVTPLGRFYLWRSWEGIDNGWEEKEVLKIVLVPPTGIDPEEPGYEDAGKLGLRVECLYLSELGKVLIDKGGYKKKGKKVVEWFDEYNISGCFRNELLFVRGRGQLILERTWEPWWPYSGSGKQIYVISIPATP